MNGSTLRTGGLILLVLVAIILYSSVFIVQQTQYALVRSNPPSRSRA
jgi:membrane protease subunit HflC